MNSNSLKSKKVLNLICILFVMMLCIGIGPEKENHEGKIYINILIENIEIGKLTKEQAKTKLEDCYQLKPIKIIHEDRQWYIKPDSINLYYNFDEVINKAYNYTRDDDIKENIKRKINLKLNKPYNLNLFAYYNENKLSEEIEKICRQINVPVKDASILIKDNSEIITTESKEGKEVDIIKLKEIIYNLIDKKNIKDVNLPVNIIKPKVTTQNVNSINTVLGQYSTSFNNHSARGNNIYVAGRGSSDIILMPGDIFSFNKATGARTWSKGYKTAKVIVGGKFVDGEGGGVCQVSSTIFNAGLLAGLDIIEVHNHTYPSRYAPRGRDAAVSYGFTDLKLRNPYSHPIYIKNIVNNGSITSKIFGCKEDREKLYIRTEQKYDKDKINVKTYRIHLDEDNNKVMEELIFESKYKINI